jgi:hypothetical protein
LFAAMLDDAPRFGSCQAALPPGKPAERDVPREGCQRRGAPGQILYVPNTSLFMALAGSFASRRLVGWL